MYLHHKSGAHDRTLSQQLLQRGQKLGSSLSLLPTPLKRDEFSKDPFGLPLHYLFWRVTTLSRIPLCSLVFHPARRTMSALRFEELEPVASPGGWTLTVTVNQIGKTPGGTDRVLRSEKYNFKRGAENETAYREKSRAAVKRVSRQRCLDKFDEAKSEGKKAKRRKQPKPAAAQAAAIGGPGSADLGHAHVVERESEEVSVAETAPASKSRAAQRDWVLLRRFPQLKTASAVLAAVRESDLDDPDEPWSARRVQERYHFLRRSVRAVTELVGMADPMADMHELQLLCSHE